jgi:hypothetical protein
MFLGRKRIKLFLPLCCSSVLSLEDQMMLIEVEHIHSTGEKLFEFTNKAKKDSAGSEMRFSPQMTEDVWKIKNCSLFRTFHSWKMFILRPVEQ